MASSSDEFQVALRFARRMRGRRSPEESYVLLEPMLISLELQASLGSLLMLREREGALVVDECLTRAVAAGGVIWRLRRWGSMHVA